MMSKPIHPRYQINELVRDDPQLRTSFDALAQASFGISFERWYQAGCWDGNYRCYVVTDGPEVVSNVAANTVVLDLPEGTEDVLMLSTVMTSQTRRGKGFASELLRLIAQEYPDRPCYLFCNSEAYNFYTRQGFCEIPIYRGYRMVAAIDDSTAQNLDVTNPEHLAIIRRLLEQGPHYGVTQAQHIALWYCFYALKDAIWYWPQWDVLAIAEIEDTELHLYGVFGEKIHWEEILAQLCTPAVQQIVFEMMPPDLEGVRIERFVEPDTHWMVREKNIFPQKWVYPTIFRA
jgi:GNAT superfamily N-acetyltransferase